MIRYRRAAVLALAGLLALVTAGEAFAQPHHYRHSHRYYRHHHYYHR